MSIERRLERLEARAQARASEARKAHVWTDAELGASLAVLEECGALNDVIRSRCPEDFDAAMVEAQRLIALSRASPQPAMNSAGDGEEVSH